MSRRRCAVPGAGAGKPATSGPFQFSPLPSSAACVPGGVGTFPAEQPFLSPEGFVQTVIAKRRRRRHHRQLGHAHAQRARGPQAGRFLYHSHEVLTNGMVSVTDLQTGETQDPGAANLLGLPRRPGLHAVGNVAHWRGNAAGASALGPPSPRAAGPGRPMYDLHPVTGEDVPLPALGARAHEGMRIDPAGQRLWHFRDGTDHRHQWRGPAGRIHIQVRPGSTW